MKQWADKWIDRAKELKATHLSYGRIALRITAESGRYCPPATVGCWIRKGHSRYPDAAKHRAAELRKECPHISIANMADIIGIEYGRRPDNKTIRYWLSADER